MSQVIHLALAGFTAGVVLLQRQAALPPTSVALVIAGMAALTVLAGEVARADAWTCRARGLALFAAALLVGFGYAGLRAERRLADALPATREGDDLRVIGVVDEMPRLGAQGVRFVLAVEAVEPRELPVPERVSLAWYAAPPGHHGDDSRENVAPPVPEVHAGERWTFTVRLQRPHGSVNPGGFDLEAWLLQNDLRATGYVRSTDDARRLDAFAGRPRDYVERQRERVRDRILAVLAGSPAAGVLAALAVGDQRAVSEAQWGVFNRTGVSHLISISGLHVTVFAFLAGGLAYHLLRRMPALTSRCAARRPALVAALALAAGYVALAGAEVPALRTLAMLAIAAVGLWLDRPGTGRVVWLWSLAAVLLADPFAPLAAGFWLSYGAVGLLIYALGSRCVAPRSGRPARLLAALGSAARTQWTVTVGLVPLTLALFGQVSLVAPLANALAIPLVTFAIVPATLLAVAVPFEFPLQLADAMLRPLLALLDVLAALPEAAWQQHAPLPWTVVAGTLGTLLLLAPQGWPGRALGVAWLVPLFLARPEPPAPGTALVTVLDVGQGLAVAVRTHAHLVVYDTGPRYSEAADAGGRIVAPFLRAAGTPRMDGLVVSHRDTDHSGGALSLLATVPAGWLLSSLDATHPIVQRGTGAMPALRCQAGQRWTWDGVDFAILHPAPEAYAEVERKSNDLSCVLAIATAHGRVLVTGDAEARSERELLARDRSALRAEVLVVPHHGSRTSSTAAFIAAVEPAVAIFAAGYRNRFGHPRPDVVARYAERGTELVRTDADGAVVVTLREGGPVVERWRQVAGRYWHRQD